MASHGQRRCRHCGHWFTPDRYNVYHQEYCSRPECRAASKAASQKKWLAKNPDYFSGEQECQCVRECGHGVSGRQIVYSLSSARLNV